MLLRISFVLYDWVYLLITSFLHYLHFLYLWIGVLFLNCRINCFVFGDLSMHALTLLSDWLYTVTLTYMWSVVIIISIAIKILKSYYMKYGRRGLECRATNRFSHFCRPVLPEGSKANGHLHRGYLCSKFRRHSKLERMLKISRIYIDYFSLLRIN